MKDIPTWTPRSVSPYLLKRLRSVEEATAEIQSRALCGAKRRRRDVLTALPELDEPDEPADR